MKKHLIIAILLFISNWLGAQQLLTPELLLKIGRIRPEGISRDGKYVVYTVVKADMTQNTATRNRYYLDLQKKISLPIKDIDSLLVNPKISPDGLHKVFERPVKILNIKGNDYYPTLDKSNVLIYNDLDYRHWNHWNDGTFNHVFFSYASKGKNVDSTETDIMKGDPFYSPQSPLGGAEDYIWSPDSKHILYVTKKKAGKDYVTSTNTDIYEYDIVSHNSRNISKGMNGYDTYPSFSRDGKLAWLSMKQDGNEADKQDIIVLKENRTINITAKFKSIHVEQFKWSNSGKEIFFKAPIKGTVQLFKIAVDEKASLKQISKGAIEIKDIIGETETDIIATIQQINRPDEIFAINKNSGDTIQLTHVNDAVYDHIKVCKTSLLSIPTTDHLKMATWVIYPPDFDSTQKYPSILFCPGGPQSSIPLYLINWNFQLMASMGYVVIVPERRGMIGEGIEWTKQVSKDWGGLAIKDYLSAIDYISREKYIDKKRRACIGPSFGGYSIYMLESMHQNRFKTFVAHAGVFDLRGFYGTNPEVWFSNWELGGNYWDVKNKAAQRSYSKSPSNFVSHWNTPILITQGGIDYAVPSDQSLQAFQAAQLKGLKSRLVYFPTEGHFISSPQNALIFQQELFKWLKETL